MLNTSYLNEVNKIGKDGIRQEHLDYLSAVCLVHGEERIVKFSKFAPFTLFSFLDDDPIGDKVNLYFNNEDGESDFRQSINLLDNRDCKLIRPSHNPSNSGYFYYISNNSDSIVKIDICGDNKLNAIATKVSISSLLDNMDDSCILLNESMGDTPYLSRFPEYIDRYNSIIDNRQE